jgi:hypothetical protein
MNNQERIIATIRKGNRNVVVITEADRRIGIRQHEPNGKRELIPTRKGISNIDLADACEIANAILRVAAAQRS